MSSWIQQAQSTQELVDTAAQYGNILVITAYCVCGGIVSMETDQLEGLHTGVPCDSCKRSYTLLWRYGPTMQQDETPSVEPYLPQAAPIPLTDREV